MAAPFELNLDDLGDEHIDEAVALDAGAIPFRPAPGAPLPGNKTKTPPPDCAAMSREGLADLITARTHYFGPGCELLRRDAYAELPQSDAEANLRDIFDTVPMSERDRKWEKGRSRIGSWATHVYDNVAKGKGNFLRNLIGFFAEDDRCRGAIRRNNFTHDIEVAEPFPTPLGQMPGALRPLLDPEDIIQAVMLAQENGFPRVSKGIVRDALLTVARERSYHPVREWLDLRQWDGILRISRLFIDYLPGRLPSEAARQARDNRVAYYEGVATCFMVGAVARIMTPGAKVDCLPVLIGNQGWNKSQGVQALIPYAEWFSDDLSTALIDRDTKESLTGKWLIELAEFPHIHREIERVKAFFSRQSDRYRRAYDTSNRDWGRQCAFIATANELEFIDHTGNRRFWPIPLRAPADRAAIERDRDQLWGEAIHLYREGYRWWLPPSIEAIAATFQASFFKDDPMENKVVLWLAGDYPPLVQVNGVVKGVQRYKVNGEWPPFTTTIALRGIGYSSNPEDRGYPTRSEEMHMSRVLKRLGYRQSHTTVSSVQQRWWFPVTDAPDDE